MRQFFAVSIAACTLSAYCGCAETFETTSCRWDSPVISQITGGRSTATLEQVGREALLGKFVLEMWGLFPHILFTVFPRSSMINTLGVL